MNFREKHNARIASGKRVQVPERHDLGVIDPREQFAGAPTFVLGEGHLPQVYEDYIQNNVAEYGGDPAAYAAAFLAVHCSVLHSTVEMQTRPNMPDNWKNPNDHSLTLGSSGSNKSGMFKDLTKHQEGWQDALDKGTTKRRGQKPVRIYSQGGSVEGVLRRIADNNGERLCIGNDEAMSFYQGTGSHHQGAGTSMMTDVVCRVYDGKMYSKDLVNERNSFHIPKCLGTMIFATVFEKFSGWEGFQVMVSSGAMSRTTVGMVSNPLPRNKDLLIEGATKAMADSLLRLRSLKHVRFVLDPEVHDDWSDYIDAREARNKEIASMRENEGFVNWCRKYDTRVMSMATVLQALDFTASEQSLMAGVVANYDIPQSEDKVGGGDPEQGRVVYITRANLEKAINFHENFLLDTQEYFYGIADGVTEFGPELMNWVARRVTTHSIDTPELNKLTRNDLIYKGPACVRPKNGVTEALKEKQDRWVQALLDHGYIMVDKDKENARVMARYKTAAQEANYVIRPEFFMKFQDEATRAQFKMHDDALQTRIKQNTRENRLKLGKQD